MKVRPKIEYQRFHERRNASGEQDGLDFGQSFEQRRDAMLAVITVLMLMYFALLFGGILLADTPAPGTLRSFQSFLSGKVETATGAVEGREALLMIAGLPAALALMATAIGIIAHLPLA